MASMQGIRAGRAFVELFADDSKLVRKLRPAAQAPFILAGIANEVAINRKAATEEKTSLLTAPLGWLLQPPRTEASDHIRDPARPEEEPDGKNELRYIRP
jgi:hypothetical protein